MFNLTKTVAHYLKLSSSYRDNKITTEEVQEMIERDIQAHVSMFNKGLLTEQEYDSYIQCVSEFEDLIEDISTLKQHLKEKQNGQSKG